MAGAQGERPADPVAAQVVARGKGLLDPAVLQVIEKGGGIPALLQHLAGQVVGKAVAGGAGSLPVRGFGLFLVELGAGRKPPLDDVGGDNGVEERSGVALVQAVRRGGDLPAAVARRRLLLVLVFQVHVLLQASQLDQRTAGRLGRLHGSQKHDYQEHACQQFNRQ